MRVHAVVLVIAVACGHSHHGVSDGAASGHGAAHRDAPAGGDGSQMATELACGSAMCAATPYSPQNSNNDNYCCLPMSTAGSATCVHGNLGACEAGNPWYCDQAADCNAGMVCCEAARAGMFACYPAAMCGAIQACRTTAECTNGQSCTPRTCGGTPIATCGPLTTQEATQLSCM